MKVPVRIAAIAAALLVTAAPAAAQQFSDSHQFLEAIRKSDGATVMKYLNEPGTRIVDTKDRYNGEAALHIVVRRRDPTYLSFLLQRNANPNIQDSDGNTPMMIAADIGYVEGVEALVDRKANVNLANSRGETPLIRAVQRRDLEMVRLLLNSGADPDQADVLAGKSARDYARIDNRSPAITKALEEAPKLERKKAVAGPKL